MCPPLGCGVCEALDWGRDGWLWWKASTRRNFLSCGVIRKTTTSSTALLQQLNFHNGLLIKFLGWWWRSQLLMWGDSHSLVGKCDHSSGVHWERPWDLAEMYQKQCLRENCQKFVFNWMVKCYQFQSIFIFMFPPFYRTTSKHPGGVVTLMKILILSSHIIVQSFYRLQPHHSLEKNI